MEKADTGKAQNCRDGSVFIIFSVQDPLQKKNIEKI